MVDKQLSLKVQVNFNRYGLHSYAFRHLHAVCALLLLRHYKGCRPGQAPAGPHDRMNGRFNVGSGRMENPSATGCSGSATASGILE